MNEDMDKANGSISNFLKALQKYPIPNGNI